MSNAHQTRIHIQRKRNTTHYNDNKHIKEADAKSFTLLQWKF